MIEKISIIIVTYNTCKLTLKCISSILKYTFYKNYEIIVVDNASSDDTVKKIKAIFPQVITIENKENLGFGQANNIGIRNAKGQYILLLNSDTIIQNDILTNFLQFYKSSNLPIGALGCILKDIHGKNIHSYGNFITYKSLISEQFYKYFQLFGISYKKWKFSPNNISDYKFVDYITGADLFIPRQILNKIGYFDPQFFMYCEEVDLQKRMQIKGYQRIIINGPQIIHLEGGSNSNIRKKWSAKRFICIINSTKIYLKKYNSNNLEYLLFKIIYMFLFFMPVIMSKETKLNKILILREFLKK